MHPYVLTGHERPVTIVRFNYDGDLFFSGSAERKINLWEAYTGERIGSYQTKASVRSLDVDLNSEHLVSCGNDGSLEIFDVKSGRSLKYANFKNKLKQIEFNLGSTKFLILQDQFIQNRPSKIRVFDFKAFYNTETQSKEDKCTISTDKIRSEFEFETTMAEEKKQFKISTRALWYVDNTTFFVSTDDGYVIHFDASGKIKGSALLHEGNKINSIAFSKDFSILGTAADNGSKIIDPETFQVLRNFKQELPMNAISISPLFSALQNPKYHMVMGGGISAIMAAMTAGNAGFQAHICNIMHGNQVGKISGHFGPINSIQFFKDGRGFISGGEEGVIRVVRFSEEYFEDNPQFE